MATLTVSATTNYRIAPVRPRRPPAKIIRAPVPQGTAPAGNIT